MWICYLPRDAVQFAVYDMAILPLTVAICAETYRRTVIKIRICSSIVSFFFISDITDNGHTTKKIAIKGYDGAHVVVTSSDDLGR